MARPHVADKNCRMRTAHSLPHGKVSLTETPWTEALLDIDPLDRNLPWTETPRGQRHPPMDRDPPGQTGSDIIQRPIMDIQPPVKTLPCPKLRLRAVKRLFDKI